MSHSREIGRKRFEEAIEYLYKLIEVGTKRGLENISYLANALGNPQNEFRSIHIAGTNGKGSTSAFISSILKEAGYKTGTYTSPHLVDIRERIRIDDQDISREDFARWIEEVKRRAEGMAHCPTFFEAVTAAAFAHFASSKVDLAVIEVGMGGRLDSTNIIDPLISIITNISLEHTKYLGNTIEEIAFEKAGIIKSNGLVISTNSGDGAWEVIRETAAQRMAELRPISASAPDLVVKSIDRKGSTFDYKNYKDLTIKLVGAHQIQNALLAVEAVEALGIEERFIREGLIKAGWRGRLEVMEESPWVILDGAHNPAAVRALVDALPLFPHDKLILVFTALNDKDVSGMLQPILSLADAVVVTQVRNERGFRAREIAKIIEGPDVVIEEESSRAVERAKEMADGDDLVLITGSIYLIGEVLESKRG
ncbi:MAG: bifunctional folylpolyglutamate synthase/dihydrofolate synthase [bacterium]